MAFDLRAPVPIRFQRYISNTPVWEAGEEYKIGDTIRFRGLDSVLDTDPATTLYIATVTTGNLNQSPIAVESGFWKATSDGAVELKDIILPAGSTEDPIPAANAQAFREAINADYSSQADASTDAITDLEGNRVLTNFSNLPTDATDYAVVDASAAIFRSELDVAQGTLSVQDDDIAITGGTGPTGTISSSTVSHIRVGNVFHPLGAGSSTSAVFDYAFSADSAVMGANFDDLTPDNVSVDLVVTTTAPHLITDVVTMVSADPAFAEQPAVVIDQAGLRATITQLIPTDLVRDFNWALTVSYSTGSVDQPDASAEETFMVVVAPTASAAASFAPANLLQNTPTGVASQVIGTYTFANGYGATAAEMIGKLTSVTSAVAGFDASLVTFAAIDPSLGSNENSDAVYAAFTMSAVELDTTAVADSVWTFADAVVFNVDSDVSGTATGDVATFQIIDAPQRTTLYHGWTRIQYDGGGSGANALTEMNLIGLNGANNGQVEIYDTNGYSLGQQIMTNPEAFSTVVGEEDMSYAIAFPSIQGGTATSAIINIGGEQSIDIEDMVRPLPLAGLPGVDADTMYNVFLVKANLTDFNSFDHISVQTLVVE